MNSAITVALDAMGGDHGISVVVPAALAALAECPNLKLVLVGDSPLLEAALNSSSVQYPDRLSIEHASEQVSMEESPKHAFRNKKNSSMRIAINLVQEGRAQACVSAGNTGALMMTASFVLKRLPGVNRPALVTCFPTMKPGKVVHVLDLGADVDSSAENLLDFAVMGSVLSGALGANKPVIGLLNIGSEDIKGNETVKAAGKLLSQHPALNYRGYVEGDDVFKGEVDVVVCDGFVGNVFLKTTEGLAKMIAQFAREAFSQSMLTRLCAIAAWPVLSRLRRRIDPARYNGASLLGLQGIVIKSHGGAQVMGYTHAILEAMRQVEQSVPDKIRDEVTHWLSTSKVGETS